MKFNRIFAVVALAAALVATSCEKYDDSKLVSRVDNLDSKVEALESAVSSLKSAVDNKYAVESVEQTANGWTISFTNGKKIELVNGDSFLKSVEENAEYVVITLNDENSTVFMLPKAIKVVIGDAESTYILIDDENNEVALDVPAIEGIAAVSGTVLSSTGSTTDVVVTKANESGWTVKIAQDYSSATIIADGAPKGSRALFVVTVTKVDGTTYTSSKPLIYFMTDDAAYELFAQEVEQLEKNWTMMRNSTLGNEEYEAYITEEIESEALTLLSSIQQMIDIKKTWAEESYNAGTLVADLDEILASFEEVNIMLTQYYNWFNAQMDAAAEDAAYELFAQEVEQLEKNWTMMKNATLGNEEYEAYITEELEDEALFRLSSIQQMIDIKKTWAEESYNAGTLAADLDEILASFEEINIMLTQYQNWFNDQIGSAQNDAAMEEISIALEGLNQQLTQMMNVTVRDEEACAWLDEETINSVTALFSGVSQHIMTLQTWAEESWAAGTLVDEINDIYAEFDMVGREMTQAKNVFDDAVAEAKNNSAFEAFNYEYEMYQMQLTGLERLAREDENDEALAAISAVSQQLGELMTWATESYEAGTLYEDLEEIMAEFPTIQSLINQVRNTYFND